MRLVALVVLLGACAGHARTSAVSASPPRTTPKAGADPDVYPAIAIGEPDLQRRVNDAFAKGDYATTIGYFKGAYLLQPHPAFLYNIAQVYRMDGNCRAALLYYERYLAADPKAPNAEEVKQRMGELRPGCE